MRLYHIGTISKVVCTLNIFIGLSIILKPRLKLLHEASVDRRIQAFPW